MTMSREQMIRDCETRLGLLENKLDSKYAESLKRATENARKYLWPVKEVAKLWEEIESL